MAYTPNNPNGQATMANSEPVVIASNQTAIPVTDNGASITVDGTVAVSNFPVTQAVSGSVNVGNFPATQPVSGTITANAGTGTMNVSVQNTSIPVTDNGGSLTVDGTVAVSNFPATQPVSGTVTANAGTGTMNVSVQNASIPITDNGGSLTVDGSVSVSNFPATQPVSGTVNIGNFPATQPVSGTIAVSNFPATQVVSGTVTANAGTGTMNVSVQNASIPVTDNGASLTTDTPQLPSTLGPNGSLRIEGCTAHDSPDAGAPVKIGYRAETVLPASVINDDRANAISDRYGRGLVSHIDPGMQVWRSGEYTTTQTGTNIWVPTTGNRFVITQLNITTAGTTAGVVTIWGAATGTTSYTPGTDQVFFKGSFVPSATGTPGALIQPNFPLFSDTTNDCLKITTSAAMTVHIQVYGYEITP
jgi:hypothetical protein